MADKDLGVDMRISRLVYDNRRERARLRSLRRRTVRAAKLTERAASAAHT